MADKPTARSARKRTAAPAVKAAAAAPADSTGDESATPGRRERAKQARRSAIVRAARALVQETGAAGFSMQALAQAADVSPMTPYNLFGSKQAVMLSVLDDDLDGFERKLARVQADELDTIFRAIRLARRAYEAEPNFYATMFRGALLGAAVHEDGVRFRRSRRAIWQRLVQRAIDAGQLLPGPGAELVGVAVSQITLACILDWIGGTLPLRQFEARCQMGVALVLLGVAAPAARQRLLERVEIARRSLLRTGRDPSAPA